MSHRVCDKPIVLNYDGHDSHETVEMQRAAFDKNIILVAFPSKMTHKTQPLDVSVFASVQNAWSQHCDKRVAEGITMDRYNVIHEYLKIRHVITPELVKTAFRKTGIYPLNPDIFTADEFAPSKSFSSVAHVPPSFPIDILSSPPAHSSELEATDAEYSPSEIGSESHSESDSESDSDLPGLGVIDFNRDMMDPSQLMEDIDSLDNNDTLPSSPHDNHSRYSTRSAISSDFQLSPVRHYVPVAEDQNKSHEELVDEVRHLRNQVNGLVTTVSMQAAELGASNAH